MASHTQIFPLVLNNLISVKAVAKHSGYNIQYLRRLLRAWQLSGMKISQLWLMNKSEFEAFLEKTSKSKDQRSGINEKGGNH